MADTPTADRARAIFVPADLDATDWAALEPLTAALLRREVNDRASLDRWLEDRSEFDAACSEAEADLYIAMTCSTDDAASASAYTRFVETIPPRLRPVEQALDLRQCGLIDRFGAAGPGERLHVLHRDTRAGVEIFRDANVPLFTELTLLGQRFEQISGAQTVRFDGEERTLAQMSRYLESPDRAVRESAWRASAERRLADRETLDALYDDALRVRDAVAKNAGFPSFREYAFAEKRRFDYGPRECEAFHDSCERLAAPAARREDERRARTMRLPALRPWDLGVDPRGRPPLTPFDGAAELVKKTGRVFARLDPELGAMFASLNTGGWLDLESRKGKAPGGYQYMRDRSRRPFIFMNAAGLHGDVRTMVHEAGHAFHSLLCVDEPLVRYRHSPIEFAEVASMAMELLTMPHWDEYYDDGEDLARARREQVEGALALLPWVATVDAFQHWAHRSVGHTHSERRTYWLGLGERFGRRVDWDGLSDARAASWQRQPHLFTAPFYYIEYGIAQLGALQLWSISKERGEREAVERYKAALRLGGSRPLPDLFAAAGLSFDFGPATVARLVETLERELDRAPH